MKIVEKSRPWARGILATLFLGFGLALLWLGALSAQYLLSQSGGALAVTLALLGALLIFAAAWQYRLLLLRTHFSTGETLLLSPLLVLLVLPLSLATASYDEPLFVFSLAILLGILPPAISVASERLS